MQKFPAEIYFLREEYFLRSFKILIILNTYQILKKCICFRSCQVKILIATDVASRGLDIPEVELVINHNVPSVSKDYIHRVGRTARAGKGGQAVTLVTPTDVALIQAIEEMIKTKLTEYEEVKDDEVTDIHVQVGVTKRQQDIKLSEMDFDEKKNINKRKKLIMQGLDPDQVEKDKKKAWKHKKRMQQKERKMMQRNKSHLFF